MAKKLNDGLAQLPQMVTSKGEGVEISLEEGEGGGGGGGGGDHCCWFSSLLREVFLRVLRFSPLLKNQHFQIPIDSEKPREG